MDTQNRKTFTLLTFLGRSGYDEVFYVWKGRRNERQTKFVVESIADLVGDVDKVIACATEEVKNEGKHTELQKALQDKVREITIVDIPSGKDEAEIWQIFDRIVSALSDEKNVIIDITHGFRSLPMIVFSVADYLRKAKGGNIVHLLYGAYEARTENQKGEKETPIFDLTLLFELIEWAGGVETFLKRGDASLLGEKMREKQGSLYRRHSKGAVTPNHPALALDLPKKLQSVGEKFKHFSLSLHLARPIEVLKGAQDLLELLEQAKGELEKWAKPFAEILDKVQEELKKLAHKDSDQLTPKNLEKQLGLIEYYIEKNLLIQAVLLSREWLVSLYIYKHLDLERHKDWLKREVREQAENELNKEPCKGGCALVASIKEVWKALPDLRNDLAHCGMRERPRPSTDIQQNVKSIPKRLRRLWVLVAADSKGGT